MSKQSELVVISQNGITPAAPSFNPRLTAPDAGTAVTTTYAVTVGSYGGANRYYLDGVVYPKLTLSRTYIYIFDLSHSTNVGHPLRFKWDSGYAYSPGVVVVGTPGSAGAKVTLTVASDAPDTLRYYCTSHGNGMGNTIAITNSASLDVGTNNYFDSGNLTANTSVSFTNVPTSAEWKYSCVTPNSDAFDISKSVFVRKYSTSVLYTEPKSVFFKYDGTRMFTFSDDTDKLYQYDLSTAWDVSTATAAGLYSLSSSFSSTTGIFFSKDGLNFALCDVSSTKCVAYTLTKAWDITTLVYQNAITQSQDASPSSIHLNDDGSKMYLLGKASYKIYEYNLSTPWNMTTASLSQSFSVATQDTQPTGLTFNSAGTSVYVCDSTWDNIYQYDLSTAWDISTSNYSKFFSVTGEDTDPEGLYLHPEGTHMYLAGLQKSGINEYTIGATKTITLPPEVVGTASSTIANDRVTYTFVTTNSGSTVNLIAEEII